MRGPNELGTLRLGFLIAPAELNSASLKGTGAALPDPHF